MCYDHAKTCCETRRNYVSMISTNAQNAQSNFGIEQIEQRNAQDAQSNFEIEQIEQKKCLKCSIKFRD